jgi:shikimate kinase
MNIFLLGFMGSGKTTIGKLLAAKMKYKFVDLDSEIESAQGLEISQIFSKIGEQPFREMERDTLAEIIGKDNQIVSVGGGLPCFHNNMGTMNGNGKTVYLKMSPGAILSRLLQLPQASRASRPLIANKTNDELSEYIKSTLLKREPFYNQAKIVVLNETSDLNITLGRIITALSMQKND